MKRSITAVSLFLLGVAACSTSAHAQDGKPAHAVININTATEKEIAYLPGVGPELASEIYAYAEGGAHIYDPKAPLNSACDHRCHFATLGDLLKVKGIGPKRFARIAPFVCVDCQTTATAEIKDGAE